MALPDYWVRGSLFVNRTQLKFVPSAVKSTDDFLPLEQTLNETWSAIAQNSTYLVKLRFSRSYVESALTVPVAARKLVA